MIGWRTIIRLAIVGAAVGAVLVATTDPNLIRSGPDGLLVAGYGVDSVFRVVPALAGAFVVVPAASLFTAGRFGVAVSLCTGRRAVWECFIRTVTVGVTTLIVSVYLGTFLVSGISTGDWSRFILFATTTTGFPVSPPFDPHQVFLNAFSLGAFNWLVTTILIISTASIGMAFRLRPVAAALPVIVGLVVSIAGELKAGPLLDWHLKTPTPFLAPEIMTSWIGGFALIGGLAVVAAATIHHIAIRQAWSRIWP